MKVGIITFHRANNYGAALQAYALSKAIKNMNYECDIVDYRSDYMEKYYNPFLLKAKSIKAFLGASANTPIRYVRKKSFDNFRTNYLPMSEKYCEKNILEANKKYDCFVFGSDQVWNYSLTGSDLNFLGEFVQDEKKLNAYAASFGRKQIDSEYWEDYRRLLSRYNRVGIREAEGCLLFYSLTQKESCEVMDPVFLLNKADWEKLCTDHKKKYGKYIFLYHLRGSKTDVTRYANYLSRQTGLKIVDVQAWAKKYPSNIIPRFKDSPCDFLGWIQNAEYIVTDSFHCTAFSIIFEKKFWSRIDKDVEYKATRVGNLLNNLEMLDRIIPDTISEWDYEKKCEYANARLKKVDLILKSKGFINSFLEGL